MGNQKQKKSRQSNGNTRKRKRTNLHNKPEKNSEKQKKENNKKRFRPNESYWVELLEKNPHLFAREFGHFARSYPRDARQVVSRKRSCWYDGNMCHGLCMMIGARSKTGDIFVRMQKDYQNHQLGSPPDHTSFGMPSDEENDHIDIRERRTRLARVREENTYTEGDTYPFSTAKNGEIDQSIDDMNNIHTKSDRGNCFGESVYTIQKEHSHSGHGGNFDSHLMKTNMENKSHMDMEINWKTLEMLCAETKNLSNPIFGIQREKGMDVQSFRNIVRVLTSASTKESWLAKNYYRDTPLDIVKEGGNVFREHDRKILTVMDQLGR